MTCLPPSRLRVQGAAEAILAASHPGSAGDPATWPGGRGCCRTCSHVDPGAGAPGLRDLASTRAWYLFGRGDARSGYELARHLHQNWRGTVRPRRSGRRSRPRHYARGLREMGRYAEARDLDEDTLARPPRPGMRITLSTLTAAKASPADLRMLGEAEPRANSMKTPWPAAAASWGGPPRDPGVRH